MLGKRRKRRRTKNKECDFFLFEFSATLHVSTAAAQLPAHAYMTSVVTLTTAPLMYPLNTPCAMPQAVNIYST